MQIQGGESREELGGRIRTQKPKKLVVFICFLRNMLFSWRFFNVFFGKGCFFIGFSMFLEGE